MKHKPKPDKYTPDKVQEIFKNRYYMRASFLDDEKIKNLIDLLLEKNRLNQILSLCKNGEQPLKAVVRDIENFADKNGIKVDKTWKQNIGMLIGAIVNIDGYTSNKRVKFKEKYKYFRSASTFRK